MEKDELSEEELANVRAFPDSKVSIEKAIENKDLYRKKQIEALESLKEELLTEEKTPKKK